MRKSNKSQKFDLIFRRITIQFLSIFFLLILLSETTFSQSSVLVWSDEFEGNELNLEKWNYDIGRSNDNVHYYTDRPQNVSVGDGVLKITALKESYEGYEYTSGLIKTKGTSYWQYGRIEARIKLPPSNGFVPAFWMLPEDNIYGWWPKSGEIDIMEHPTNEVNKIYGTVHTQSYNSFTGSGPRGDNVIISDAQSEFHIYAIEWNENQIDFFVDDQKYFSFSNDRTSSKEWPFDQKFYLILNLAVGGGWVGNPDQNTIFPAIMEIDYVRVYQELKDIQLTGPDFLLVGSTNIKYAFPFLENAVYSWEVPSSVNIISDNQNSIITNWGNIGGTIRSEMIYDSQVYHSEIDVNVSTNYLKNHDFEKGVKYWRNSVGYPADANFSIDTIDIQSGNASLKIDVNNLGSFAWDIQLSQGGFLLESDKQYAINFWAKELNGNTNINVALINPNNFNVLKLENYVLTPEWKKYSFSYNSNNETKANLNVDFGIVGGTYYLDNFSFTSNELSIPNILSNSDFSNSTDNWFLTVLGGAEASGVVENEEYKISITNGGNNPWDIFLGQAGITLENGKQYLVSFDAYSESSRTISSLVGKNSDPWTVYSGDQTFTLDEKKTTYSYNFSMNSETDNQARLGFDVGNSEINVYFDNIILIVEEDTLTSLKLSGGLPSEYKLMQNYPNPFNPSTKIKYSIPKQGHVSLKLYNVQGREVVTLIDRVLSRGRYDVEFDGSTLTSGIYFYKLKVNDYVETKKMVLLK